MLDGELAPADQHELNRDLLRSPQARRVLSDYRDIDRLAAEVMTAVVDGRCRVAGPTGRTWTGRRTVLWSGVFAGLAAAAIIMVVAGLTWQGDHSIDKGSPDRTAPIALRPQETAGPQHLVPVGMDLLNRGQRRIDRDYVGVFDEARGTLYVFEVNRTRTVRIPVAGDL